MSFLRIVFGALLATLSVFAINANADTQANSANAQPQAAAAPAAAPAAAKAHHHAMVAHHKEATALVDINTATAADLTKVRGIGKKKAELIIAARSKGNFNSVDDLKTLTNAKGKPLFTAKGFEHIAKRLTVSSAAPAPANQ